MRKTTHCELCQKVESQGKPTLPFKNSSWLSVHRAADPHHIFHSNSRADVRSNLLAVCRQGHSWLHMIGNSGKVVAVWCKLFMWDFDPEEIEKAIGQNPIGMIEAWAMSGELLDWCKPYADDILRQYDKL